MAHEFTVDTGACDHVTAPTELPLIPTVRGKKTIEGVKYEVANGDEIDNVGEKRAILATDSSRTALPITIQVCDVHKSLLSVGKIVGAGKRVVFDADSSGGSYIEDKVTKEKLPLTRQGNLWTLSAWIRKAPVGAKKVDRPSFGRQE